MLAQRAWRIVGSRHARVSALMASTYKEQSPARPRGENMPSFGVDPRRRRRSAVVPILHEPRWPAPDDCHETPNRQIDAVANACDARSVART
jgi:hypothetical protein